MYAGLDCTEGLPCEIIFKVYHMNDLRKRIPPNPRRRVVATLEAPFIIPVNHKKHPCNVEKRRLPRRARRRMRPMVRVKNAVAREGILAEEETGSAPYVAADDPHSKTLSA